MKLLQEKHKKRKIFLFKFKVILKNDNIENIMFMSFDMKFIRRYQKTRGNGEALLSHSAFSSQA